MEPTSSLAAQVAVAVTVFVATDIDDLVLLAAFFADPRLARRSIVAGQLLGIAALFAASALAALLAFAVPPGWVALLGLAPLYLGVKGLIEWWRGAAENDEAATVSEHALERRTSVHHSQMLAVAAVTVANGGDNLGVYIPLFASQPSAMPVYATVFAVMTALWCVLGQALVRNPWVGERFTALARRALPFVLVALGLHIVSGARVLF